MAAEQGACARSSSGGKAMRAYEHSFLSESDDCDSNDDADADARERVAPLSPNTRRVRSCERRATATYRVGTGRRGQRDGEIHCAAMNRPFGVCAVKDGAGTLAFTDMHNNAVRFVVQQGSHSSLVPATARVVQTMGATELLTPKGICASEDGRYLFVCDAGHHKIKFASLPASSALASANEILAGIEMFPFAGSGKKGWRDGPVLESSFNSPAGVWQCADGAIVVADTGNHCIRQILRTTRGALVVRTIAGGYASYHVRGQERIAENLGDLEDFRRFSKRSAGYRDGRRALFRSPSGIVEGPHGELLVADTMNNCIRGLLPSSDGKLPWETRTICGVVGGGYTDGSCEIAAFRQPMSICMGPLGSFFVADRGNSCIRQIGGCHAQLSGSKTDALSYSWVRTIEIGVVPQSVLEASVATLGECAVDRLGYPLGVLFLSGKTQRSRSQSPVSQRSGDEAATLVVCDGGANVIECLSFAANINGVIRSSEQARGHTRSFSPLAELLPSRRSTREMSAHSVADTTGFGGNQDSSNNQCSEEQRFECACGSAGAWRKLVAMNTALQTENARLKELLHRTKL